MPLRPWVDFSSGYFQRAVDRLPKQGTASPWKLNQNDLVDVVALRWRAVDDGVLQFMRQAPVAAAQSPIAACAAASRAIGTRNGEQLT